LYVRGEGEYPPDSRVFEARSEIRHVDQVGGQPISLIPTDNGGLEAEMTGDYAGLVRLIEEDKLNNSGCGGSIRSRFNPSLTIALTA